MKPVELPNGFVLDLDSVHYIGSERQKRHPFTEKLIDEVELTIHCEGCTHIEMYTTKAQADEIKQIILKNLNERDKR